MLIFELGRRHREVKYGNVVGWRCEDIILYTLIKDIFHLRRVLFGCNRRYSRYFRGDKAGLGSIFTRRRGYIKPRTRYVVAQQTNWTHSSNGVLSSFSMNIREPIN